MIENKTTAVGVRAAEQLLGYVDSVRAERAGPGQEVHGLLLADGRTIDLQSMLWRNDIDYLSLSEVGYRDYLYSQRELGWQAEPDGTTAQSVVIDIEPAVPA
jgi:RecB family endonuclease NucS